MPSPISNTLWLITSGGMPLLVLGIILANVSLVFWIFPHRTLSLLAAILSVLPAVLAMFVLCTAVDEVSSINMPNTSRMQISEFVGETVSYAFCGTLGSTIAMLTSIAALRRSFLTRNVSEGPKTTGNA